MNNFLALQGNFAAVEASVLDLPLPPGPLTFVGLYVDGSTSGSPTGRTISVTVQDSADETVVVLLDSTTWAVGLSEILPTEAKVLAGDVIVPEGGPYLLRVSVTVTGGTTPTATMRFLAYLAH